MDLTDKEIYVLRKRFGLGEPALTLNEIGQRLKVSSQRISQIQDKALRKLLHPSRRYFPIVDEIINAKLPRSRKDSYFFELIKSIKERDRKLTPIHDLDLSVRAVNILLQAGLYCLGLLKEKKPTYEELLQIKNCGPKTAREIDSLIKTL